ncbi:MAG: hypothetical protein MJY44_02875, partial [Bacteroidales bacterium]|nr:hypothetical protein [Bacteroidales bacterium]
MEIPPFIAFWRNWDADERRTASIVTGAAVAAFCVFFLISVLSYLFHWQQDMSLLGDIARGEVSNKAGTLGLRFGHFLVADCFGLGSFALLLVFVPLCIRLFSFKARFSLLKAALLAVVGAFVFSFVLAYADLLLGGGSAFGGGLGGECGAVVVKWITDLTGEIVGGCIIAVFVLLWLVLAGLRWRARTIEEEFSGWENGDSAGPAVESVEDEGPDAVEVVDVAAEDDAVAASGGVAAGDAAEVEEEGGLEIVRDEDFGKVSSAPLKRIDNRLDPPDGLPSFKFPELSLLGDYKSSIQKVSNQELSENNNKIRSALADYRIQVSDVVAVVGPTVTLYKVYPAAGVKIAEIKRLQDDIALKLNARGVRVVTLSDSVGIEVANECSSTVPLKSLIASDAFAQSKYELPVALGYTIT